MNKTEIRPLVQKAMEGQTGAFDALCRSIAGDVLYICIKITGHPQLGEDAAQEVLLQLQRGIVRLRSADAFTTWLNRCISRTCMRMIMQERRGNPVALEEAGEVPLESKIEFLPGEWAEQEEMRGMVLQSLDALPGRQKHILNMFYFQELSLKELAGVLEISEAAAGMALTRARRALKRSIEKKTGVPLEQKSLSGGATGLPILTLMLRGEVAQVATAEMQARLVVAVSAGIAGAASAASGVAGTVAGGLHLSSWLTSLGTSLLVGAVAGSVLYAAAPPEPPGYDAPPQQQQASVQSDSPDALLQSLPLQQAEGSEAPQPSLGRETTSPASTPQQQPPPPAAEAPVTVQGDILLPLPNGAGGGSYAAGYHAEVWADGTLLAASVADGAGRYRLQFNPGGQSDFVLRLYPAFGHQCGFVGGARVYEAGFTRQDAEGDLPPVYLADDRAPTGFVYLVNEAGEELQGSAVNPAAARLSVQDATETVARWAVYEDGTLHAEGEGALVPLDSLPTDAAGRGYMICFTITDLGGNTSVLEREFWLIAGL